MKKNLFLLFLAGAMIVSGAEPGKSWNHDPRDLKIGPGAWSDVDTSFRTCAANVGKKQSPVNIISAQAVGATFQPLVFTDKGPVLALENTDHVLEVHYAEGSTVKVGSQPTDLYELGQWHLHIPSEHRIDGREYSAELHMVFQNLIGEFLVVGVLMDEKIPPTANLDKLIQSFPRHTGSVPFVSGAPPLAGLLPANRNFYRYLGSLTTPPCTESVQWFVMRNPVGITPANVKILHGLVSAFTNYHGYPNNNRPPADLNGRKILTSLP